MPLVSARQHAEDFLISVDNPLLAVGANGNMGTSTRKPVPVTILELVQSLSRVNANGAIVSPGVNLERGKAITERVGERPKKISYLRASTRYLVPFAGGNIPSENSLASAAAPDGIIDAGRSPNGGTRECYPARGVVIVVPLVDRLA